MYLLRFKEWPILTKIITISIVSVTFITLVILLYFMPLVEQKMLDGKKEGLKNVVDVAFGIFHEYDTLATNGQMSLADVKAHFAQRIKAIRYGQKDYFWINDMKLVMIMHPIKSELDGTDLTDNKDSNGKYLFREFVAVCQSRGAGFVDYMWPKPGEETAVPKISYVKLYEPWGWLIGSGIYIDDVRHDINRLRFYMLTGTLIFSILTISFAVVIGTGITRPLKKVIDGLQDIASGKGQAALTKRITITSKDEIGILSREFNSLMESINDLSVFKKVVEEDDSLDEVYQRIGEVFTQQIGIGCCFIYQIIHTKNAIHLTFPSSFDQAEMLCNQNILDDCDLCKAKRTGHVITSTIFPAICRQFKSQNGRVHYCLPIVVGGAAAAVVQFVFDAPNNPSDVKAMEAKVFKAEQYINESLAVIETKRLMSTLHDSALIDTLTGLYNRRYLQEYTEKIVAGVLRRGKTIGLVMCDLDYFKQVNDTYGHAAGDIVLKQTSDVIKQSVRDSDIVIRFGGEEFLAVLLDISNGESMIIAEKIRTNIQQLSIKLPDGVIQKTISLGASEFPADTGTLWSCIKYADVALYRAKEEGRNRSVRFTRDMWKEDQI
jgi:diguanylate cyclase (GGDEF)-like protein